MTGKEYDVTTLDLARDRTALAYDRTFFALIRTGISLVGFGVAVARAVDLSHSPWVPHVIGAILVVAGAVTFVMAYKSRREVFGHEHLSAARVAPAWAVLALSIGLLLASGLAALLVLT